MRGTRPLLLVGVSLILGCVQMHDPPPSLPTQTSIVRDQLVLSSSFALPKNHRLIEELAAQRYDLATKLALPTSDEPIHVYLFDNAHKFNLFMKDRYPDFPARRAFFIETDTELVVYAQWGDRVAEDLRHEVSHGYLHAVVPNLPLWLDEGLAEYFEVPRGHHGVNRAHVDDLGQRLSSQAWQPNLQRLEALENAAEMQQGDYAESWAWVHYMLESRPEAGAILRTYLAELRKDGSAGPLSLRLRQYLPGAHVEVVAHVQQLAKLPTAN